MKKDKKSKTNMFDYLMWRGDIPFTWDGVNEVDALIFTTLAYLDFPDGSADGEMTLKEAAGILSRIPKEERPEGPDMIMDEAYEFIELAASSERYGNLGISDFVNKLDHEKELQFSAVTFHLPDGSSFIGVRGTDNNLIGWKEDMALSFSDEVPAQTEAARYMLECFEKYSGPVSIGGHSKGGNLAIFAAARLPSQYRERLAAVYNNDGPGFNEDFMNSEGYIGIKEKIRSFIPESSIVGVLMGHDDYNIVSSMQTSILQHAPFSWRVSGPEIVRAENRTASGEHLDKAANSWIRSMSLEERESFVDTLFEILMAADARTLGDLDRSKVKTLKAIGEKLRKMDPEQKKVFRTCLNKIFINEDTKSDNKIIRLLFGGKDK